jgi:hypothetical protein
MNSFSRCFRFAKCFAMLVTSAVVLHQDVAGQEKILGTPTSPLRRYLLVASEGLYVVEPNGRPSWSYNPSPFGKQSFDEIIYDGWALPEDHFIYSTHRYAREIDCNKRTLWEYRVSGDIEVKSCVPLSPGRVALLNSEEQAILELETRTNKVLNRIPVPAKGSHHTRYMLLRRTPEGNYLVALREEKRFVEVDPSGKMLHSVSVPDLPVMAQRLADGSTLASGRFGLVRLDAESWKSSWTFTPDDTASHFPFNIAWGTLEMPDHSLLVVNDDWHIREKDQNRVQLFTLDSKKNISWFLPATAFAEWKHSEVEPRTGLTEHRCVILQPLHPAAPGK